MEKNRFIAGYRFLIAFSIMVFILSGCSGLSRPRAPDVPPHTRFAGPGYSILPPSGEGWKLARFEQGSIEFTRSIEPSGRVISAAVSVDRTRKHFNSPEQFKELAILGKRITGPPGRNKVFVYGETLDPRFGEFCVRYLIKSVDSRAPGDGGNTEPATVQTFGYIFLHPDDPELLIDLKYSERYFTGDPDPMLNEAGMDFANGFQLEATIP